MFKYLIRKQILAINSNCLKTNIKCFASKNRGEQKSFLDKLKEKFSIKTEEKIEYSRLKTRNEHDDALKASKLENLDDYEEEGIVKEERSMNQISELAIDHINIELNIEKKVE